MTPRNNKPVSRRAKALIVLTIGVALATAAIGIRAIVDQPASPPPGASAMPAQQAERAGASPRPAPVPAD